MEQLFLQYKLTKQDKEMTRRSWSQRQDKAVVSLVDKHGTKSWSVIAHELHTIYRFKQRTGKQCRQRYHNHLDPKVSKRAWTIEEQEIMFRMHKVHGNRWTVIADQLQGRSDNTIKNHFYSTIRRSLRRMSKLIGQKNSTLQLKYIKPSTLSKIFAIPTYPQTEQQIQEEKKKCLQNNSYRRLVEYLGNDCKQLTDAIMEFSKFKPKGKDCVIAEEKRGRFEAVLQKMEALNNLYEEMREQQRKFSSLTKPVIDDSSSSSQSDGSENVCSNDKEQLQVYTKKRTRSMREVRVPKKFYSGSLSQNKKTVKLNKPDKEQNEPLIEQYNIKQANLEKSNIDQNLTLKEQPYEHIPDIVKEKQSVENHQHDQSMEQEDDRIVASYCGPELQLSGVNQNPSELEHFPMSHLHLVQTPTYGLPTSFYLSTPTLQMYQTPPNIMSAGSRGLFSHIQGGWNMRNGELDDMVMNLGSQIAKNTSEVRQKEDGRTIISNINCSPHSAFRTCQ